MSTGLILAAPFVVLLLIAVIWSMIRGVTKSRIRFVCVLLCAVVAFVVAINLHGTVEQSITDNAELIEENIGEDEKVQELWAYFNSSEELQDVVIQLAVALAAPFIFVAVFIALRIVTWILYFIVTLILHSKIKRIEERRRLRMLRSVAYGLLQFIVIAFVFLAPIYVLAQSADVLVDTADELELFDEDVKGQIEEYQVKEVKSDPILSLYGKLGGNAISARLTTMSIGDEKTTLQDELVAMSGTIEPIMTLSKAGEIKNYGPEEAQAIKDIAEKFTDSKILTSVLGQLIEDATDAWIKGEAFLGVEKPDFGAGEDAVVDLSPLLDTLLRDLNADSKTTAGIKRDLNTVADIVSIFIEDNVLANMDDSDALIDSFGSGTTVEKLIAALGENEGLKNLIPEFTNIGMRAIGTMLSLPENSAEVYGEFVDDIVDALNELKGLDLTDDATIQQLSDEISDALEASGIDFELDGSVISVYAQTILADLGELVNSDEGVTAEDVREFFEIYAAANAEEEGEQSEGSTSAVAYFLPLDDEEKVYQSRAYRGKTLSELKSQSAAGLLAAVASDIAKESAKSTDGAEFSAKVKEIVERRTAEYGAASGQLEKASALLTGMQGQLESITIETFTPETLKASAQIAPETFPTMIVTVSDLLVDTSAASAKINADTIGNEAKAISQIFSGAISIKDSIPDSTSTGMDSITGITTSLGTILDGLNQTVSVGEENTSKLVTAVFQSKTVTDAMNLDLKSATELAKQATAKGDDGKAVSYTDTMSSIGKGAALAEKIGNSNTITEEEIRELLDNMTPQTANMIRVYMTAERLAGYGIGAERAAYAAPLFQNLFAEMAKSEYEATYDDQTAAIRRIFDIASQAAKSGTTTGALFNRNGVEGILKISAEEAVETIMSADMVLNALVYTIIEDGEVKTEFINPFGLHIPAESADYQDCVAALRAYYQAHSEKQNIVAELNSIAALLGVDPIDYSAN